MNNKHITDLTCEPIVKNLVTLAAPIIVGMALFTRYFLVDLYFVGRLGPDAVAAVSISGNVFFVILGLAFVLGTGGIEVTVSNGNDRYCEFFHICLKRWP